MSKQFLIWAFLLASFSSYSQARFESKSQIYSFTMPDEYKSQPSNHLKNEFIFVNKSDTTSLVVNVNERPFDKNGLQSFKEATNNEIEQNYFTALQNPKIITRGDLSTYKDQTIFFHVRHTVSSSLENDFMLTYLFYNKGKEINFIFRTKEKRIDKVLTTIQNIINSVILAN
jgi:hypothetical protein